MDDNSNLSQTVEGLNQLIESSKGQKEDKATYFTLSLILPPVTIYLALFLSLRKKLLYRTLPALLILYSAITIVFNLFGLLPIKPPAQITQLGTTIEPKVNWQVTILTVLTTVLAFICLALGLYFKSKAKKEGGLSSFALWLLFAFLNLLIYGIIFLTYLEASLLFSSIAPAINSGYRGL